MKARTRFPMGLMTRRRKAVCFLAGAIALLGCWIGVYGEEIVELLEGAPPVIPHEIRTDLSCRHCHMVVHVPGELHLQRNNCQQCHVSAAATEKHLMLDIDWKAFPGTWAAEAIPVPAPKVHLVNTFEGAPPVIPHSTEWAKNCADCHTAGPTSSLGSDHLQRKNCTQCHVSIATMENRRFLQVDPTAFQVYWKSDVTTLKEGRRNASMPPTVIPHEIEGMESCLECHSPDGAKGLATTHPDRASCTQCHVSSATDDNRKFMTNSLSQLK